MPPSAGRTDTPGKGLHGRLDAPLEAVGSGRELLVGGWVLHERCEIAHVLVTFNGHVAGHAVVNEVREDVRAIHPHAPGGSRHGWTTHLQPPADHGELLAVKAYALVRSNPGEDGKRLGPWVQFADRTVRIIPSGDRFGLLDDPGEVAPGSVRIAGRAWSPVDALSRVEIAVGDGPWRRARHTLPAQAVGEANLPKSTLSGFEGYVTVSDGIQRVTVRAAVVSVDGARHELEPVVVPVTETNASPAPPQRLTTLANRFSNRVGTLLLARPRLPPRVMVGTNALTLGGAQLYLSFLLEQLQARGLEFCVVARTGGVLQDDLEANGVPVLVLGGDPPDRQALEGQILEIASFAVENNARACLGNTLLAFPALAAAQRLGLRTTWAVHESFDLGMFWREAYGRLLDSEVTDVALDALHRSDEVVFEASATSQLYTDIVPEDRHRIVHYGVDATAIDRHVERSSVARSRAQLGLRADSLVLGCVGTVEPRKGQLALARALERVPPDRRANVELLIVGTNASPYATALAGFVERAGLTSCVTIVGVTPDIYSCYEACDVLVSASDIESLPRTMLEAMLMRRPVAATAVFGVPELVVEGRNGFLCDVLDLGSLQWMLERVIATPRAELRKMGENARSDVLTAHDPSNYVEHFWGRLSGWIEESAD